VPRHRPIHWKPPSMSPQYPAQTNMGLAHQQTPAAKSAPACCPRVETSPCVMACLHSTLSFRFLYLPFSTSWTSGGSPTVVTRPLDVGAVKQSSMWVQPGEASLPD